MCPIWHPNKDDERWQIRNFYFAVSERKYKPTYLLVVKNQTYSNTFTCTCILLSKCPAATLTNQLPLEHSTLSFQPDLSFHLLPVQRQRLVVSYNSLKSNSDCKVLFETAVWEFALCHVNWTQTLCWCQERKQNNARRMDLHRPTCWSSPLIHCQTIQCVCQQTGTYQISDMMCLREHEAFIIFHAACLGCSGRITVSRLTASAVINLF